MIVGKWSSFSELSPLNLVILALDWWKSSRSSDLYLPVDGTLDHHQPVADSAAKAQNSAKLPRRIFCSGRGCYLQQQQRQQKPASLG